MNTTGREPALSVDGEITGREPGLGKSALAKLMRNIPLTSWEDQRIKWSSVRPIILVLSMPAYAGGENWFQGMDHPLVIAARSVQNQGIIQLSMSPYRGLFLDILAVGRVAGPLNLNNPTTEISLARVGYEITVRGKTTEVTLTDFPQGVIFAATVLPEDVRIGFRYLNPIPTSPYFSPLVD